MIQRSLLILIIGVCFAGGAWSENLLKNPGFEVHINEEPQHWVPFVQPKEGAVGKLSTQAQQGDYAVMLHTPTDYEKEPVNNWSQNLLQPLSGKVLHVSAWIRTEEATEAAVWIQCWRKNPWGVLKYMSSSETVPRFGTQDWDEVAFTVTVPKETDFITLRCVLLGTGTAWFDDLSVTTEGSTEKKGGKKKDRDPAEKDSRKKEDSAQRNLSTTEPAEVPTTKLQIEVAPAPGTTPVNASLEALIQSMQSEFMGIKISNEELMRLILRLERENINLIDEILLLREEVLELKSQVDTKTPRGVALPPPLVPHAIDWREETP